MLLCVIRLCRPTHFCHSSYAETNILTLEIQQCRHLAILACFLPTFRPSFLPSILPSFLPSFLPSVRPSFPHSFLPFFLSSFLPSLRPSLPFPPSFLLSFRPSFLPSLLPSFRPSFLPSFLPSTLPSLLPRFLPPSLPSFIPSNIRLKAALFVLELDAFVLRFEFLVKYRFSVQLSRYSAWRHLRQSVVVPLTVGLPFSTSWTLECEYNTERHWSIHAAAGRSWLHESNGYEPWVTSSGELNRFVDSAMFMSAPCIGDEEECYI